MYEHVLCMHIYMHICIFMYVYIWTCVYINMIICLCIYTHFKICHFEYACIDVCMHACIQVCMNPYTYTCSCIWNNTTVALAVISVRSSTIVLIVLRMQVLAGRWCQHCESPHHWSFSFWVCLTRGHAPLLSLVWLWHIPSLSVILSLSRTHAHEQWGLKLNQLKRLREHTMLLCGKISA